MNPETDKAIEDISNMIQRRKNRGATELALVYHILYNKETLALIDRGSIYKHFTALGYKVKVEGNITLSTTYFSWNERKKRTKKAL